MTKDNKPNPQQPKRVPGSADPEKLEAYLKKHDPNYGKSKQLDLENALFPHRKQQREMEQNLAAAFKKRQQKKMQKRRSPMAVGAGVIVAGLIMALANAGLPEGETIGAGVGLFALAIGFGVMVAARRAGL